MKRLATTLALWALLQNELSGKPSDSDARPLWTLLTRPTRAILVLLAVGLGSFLAQALMAVGYRSVSAGRHSAHW